MESTSSGCTLASVLGQSEGSAGLVHPVGVHLGPGLVSTSPALGSVVADR